MRESLMEILAEPRTRASLKLRVTEHRGDLIDEGELVAESGARYAIRNGIPWFVPETTYTDLDMSNAVDAARETLAGYRDAELVQASLLEPPFKT